MCEPVVDQRRPGRMRRRGLGEEPGEVAAHPVESFTRAGTSRALV